MGAVHAKKEKEGLTFKIILPPAGKHPFLQPQVSRQRERFATGARREAESEENRILSSPLQGFSEIFRRNRVAVFCHFFRSAGEDDLPTSGAAVRTHIN